VAGSNGVVHVIDAVLLPAADDTVAVPAQPLRRSSVWRCMLPPGLVAPGLMAGALDLPTCRSLNNSNHGREGRHRAQQNSPRSTI
jgi:hypothetical protein